VLHAQNVWGAIVAFSDDMVANKKRLISRSARYSGLLGVLRFGELNSGDVATSLENAEVQAWLAFDVAPTEVGATLQAAIKAKTVERVVVAATGPVPDDQLKVWRARTSTGASCRSTSRRWPMICPRVVRWPWTAIAKI